MMSSVRFLASPSTDSSIAREFNALPAPSPQLQACVVIPARNESKSIARALDALADQRNGDGTPFDPARTEIILGCNNCDDDTAAIARLWGARHPHVCLHVIEATYDAAHANVGWARRTLMEAAAARFAALSRPIEPRVMCSTDADTRVFPHWLSATLAEIAAGAEAVGGRIYLEREAGETTRRTYLLDTAYRLSAARLESLLDPLAFDPWPRHFQFFGASLALTPSAYRSVGGLPVVTHLEDVALERELTRRDLPLRHSPHVAALTSSRPRGRVQTGLSTQLQEWQNLGAKRWLVPSAREIALRAQSRRRLKNLFGALREDRETCPWQEIAHQLLVNPQELRERTQNATYFGALWDDIWESAWSNPQLRASYPSIPVEVALRELRLMLCDIGEK